MTPGYKQTKAGAFPEEWRVRLLPQVCKFRSGKAHEQYVSEFGKYVCVNSKFIASDGKIRKYSTENFCAARKGDILLVMSDLPNGRALAKAYLVEADDIYAVNQRVCSLTAYRDVPEYLFYVLNRNRYFLKFDDGVNQTHLLNPVFEQCPLVLPPTVEEQRAIAEVLSDVDALLDALDRLIAKKRDLKQAAMQQLLTGQTRLPGFADEWRWTTLGEIGEPIIGLTYKPENVRDHGLLVLRSSNIQNNRLDFSDNVYVDVEVSNHLITQIGDILICVRNGSRALIGKCIVIDERARGLTFGAFMSVYRTKFWKFIAHVFSGNGIQRQIHENMGATINQITNRDLRSLRLMLPDEKEQTAIATVLSDMDAELDTLGQRRAKTAALKQGMMQELLMGRTRLV